MADYFTNFSLIVPLPVGAALITANKIKTMSTSGWLQKYAA